MADDFANNQFTKSIASLAQGLCCSRPARSQSWMLAPSAGLLPELAEAVALPLEPRSLARLACCSRLLQAAADAPRPWARALTQQAVTVCPHLDVSFRVPLPPAGPALPPGCRVELQSLQNDAFNGKRGTVAFVTPITSGDYFEFKLYTSEQKTVPFSVYVEIVR